jgi:hypothetical protein
VDAMLEGADASLLDEWAAYSLIHPFGYTDRLLAEIAMMFFNVNRTQGAEPAEAGAFVPLAPEESGTREEEERRLLEQKLLKMKRDAGKDGGL